MKRILTALAAGAALGANAANPIFFGMALYGKTRGI